jgi:hypothetical protein
MKLTFKRREVSDLQHLRTLVADNCDAMESGLKILASNLNLGRTNVEIAALDAQQCPVLFVLGLTADDAMLVRALEAYAWCLEYPESVQRLVPASTQLGWPPRIVFVAERLLEAFVRKMRLLNFSAVDCFEFRYVEANGTTGFYLDRVDWAATAGAGEAVAPRPTRLERLEPLVAHEPLAPPEPPQVAPREEPKLMLLREEARDDDHDEAEPPIEELRDELRDVYRDEPPEEPREEIREEPKVTPREDPRVIPLVPLEEPRIVMLHETKPAPRSVEPTPTNGAPKRDSSPRSEPAPVLLKGLRPPIEAPPRRRSREVPDLLRPPAEPRAPSPRETSKPPAPAAPAASRGAHVEPKAGPTPHPRSSQQIIDPRVKGDAARADLPKSGAKSEPARNDLPKTDLPKTEPPKADLPKGDLAPTWRKFLDRLTSTFDTRTVPAVEPPRAIAPASTPASTPPPPPPSLAIQPFAADIEINDSEVAPDEAIDESHDSIGDLTDKQRRVLQGVTLPANAELAPQWKKFLDHPTLDETKIGVVRGYLQREFPLCTVYDFYDFQRNAQVFQLQDNHGKVTQLITMTAEFFDAHRDLEIRAWIEKHRLAQAMRQAGQAGVLVSQAGLQIEKR